MKYIGKQVSQGVGTGVGHPLLCMRYMGTSQRRQRGTPAKAEV